MTPAAKQLLERLNAEIDERRKRLRERTDVPQPSDIVSEMFSANPFFAKLHRHYDLASIASTGESGTMGNFTEAIDLLSKSAYDVFNFVGEGVSRLPQASEEVRHDVFSRLVQAKDLIEKQFAKEIPLDILAQTACLSRYHFLRLFKQAFKVTPHQYQLQCRLKRACELLRDTDLPAVQISFDVGFESATSFAALFKRTYGVTPMGYRFRPDADSQF